VTKGNDGVGVGGSEGVAVGPSVLTEHPTVSWMVPTLLLRLLLL